MADIIIEEMGEEYEGEDLQVTPINDIPIYIEISGLKGIDRFIGLQDTPIYYDNGKFFKVQDNKIVYTDIQWNDIEGDITSNKDFIEELNRLIIESTEEYTLQNINNGIFLHNNNSDSHPYILSTISSNYNTLDTKIDTTKSELNQSINILTNTVNNNYNTLNTNKADKATTLQGYNIQDAYTKTEVDAKVSSVYRIKGSVNSFKNLPTENLVIGDVYNTLDTGSNYVWTENGWDKLSETVDLTPYLTKEDAIKTYDTIESVNSKINDVSTSVSNLENKVNLNKNELNNNISSLTQTVQNNYTTLDTKIDTTKSKINSDISTLESKIDGKLDLKQDSLTAGNGIDIKDNVISGTKVVVKLWN